MRVRNIVSSFLLAVLLMTVTASAQTHQLHEMSLERWSKLREVERHQMQIAETYYREGNWKVAAAEYDKYVSLYETSDAASYALLRWSLCQVNLRKQNTAINDGFRSVIDYWPDSDDSIAAAYYIGKTFSDIGQTSKAKPALADIAEKQPKHLAGVFAMVELAGIAAAEKNKERKVEIWHKLTFDAIRNQQTVRHCSQAADELATHLFQIGDVENAIESLRTNYQDERLDVEVAERGIGVVSSLTADNETQGKARLLANQLVAFLRQRDLDDTTTEIAETRPRDLLFLAARVQQAAGDDAEVVKTFREIEKRFRADDTLLEKVADWHVSKKEYDKARQQYRKFADKANGLAQMATSFRQERNMESAILVYQQLVSLDTDNAVKWKSESAITYREFQKYEQAILVYQELLQEDVSEIDRWLWEIGMCYRDGSKWKEAIGFFRQTDRFPSNYQEMARCHRRLKEFREAISLYTQIAGGSESTAPWALTQIGYTQEEAGNAKLAVASFKKVCKLFPKDRYASIAHAHLQNKYKLSVTLGGAKDE